MMIESNTILALVQFCPITRFGAPTLGPRAHLVYCTHVAPYCARCDLEDDAFGRTAWIRLVGSERSVRPRAPFLYVFVANGDPEEVVDQMLSAPRARGPLRIAEVGAGTGIATRLLLEGAHSHGGLARMHAFDPSTGMLHHLQQSLFGTPDGPGLVEKLKLEGKLASDAQVLIGEGAFDSFQAGADNDIVVIAQAWHWCPDFDQALAHIATQLRPGGVLALVWNLEDRDAAPWIAKLRDLYEKFEDGAPQCMSRRSRRPPHGLEEDV